MMRDTAKLFLLSGAVVLGSCATARTDAVTPIIGTDDAFASEAIYFLLTDRFVDGDPTNNHPDQGCPQHCTFDRPLPGPDGRSANVGYLGGDLQGALNHADYIAAMGFTSVWTTPVLDNPDAAFTGGDRVTFGGFGDGGKTGYHGYWANNFFKADEHLVSDDLDVATFIARLRDEHGLGYVFDLVGNHGSPAYSMPVAQPEYGKVYGRNGEVLADHMNLHPSELSDDEPLHNWFNRTTGLAQLMDFDPDNEALLDYLVESYEYWLDQGVRAVRVDTHKEQPHRFWKKVSDRLRAKRPDLFMFGESYSFDADFIAEHTRPENGAYSVLDFPGRESMTRVFENPDSDYADILDYLHLENGLYANPYELVTFIDNHDMARMNASDEGFINAFNWLFTSRGIPAVYYGSEVNFMTGTKEHAGNRNYFGAERIAAAAGHPVHATVTRMANLRKRLPALQRGVQVNADFGGDTASFYRVLRTENEEQVLLVLLNKSGTAMGLPVSDTLHAGRWQDVETGEVAQTGQGEPRADVSVPAHGVRIFELVGKLGMSDLEARAAAGSRVSG